MPNFMKNNTLYVLSLFEAVCLHLESYLYGVASNLSD